MSRNGLTVTNFQTQRCLLLGHEHSRYYGDDLILTEAEEKANEIIMEYKRKALKKRPEEPLKLNCSSHPDDYKNTSVFSLLSKLPKGGLLRCYDFAMCTVDFIVELTSRPMLWGLHKEDSFETQEFRFSRDAPPLARNADKDVAWVKMCSIREEYGAEIWEQAFRKRVVMSRSCESATAAWEEYMSIYYLLKGLLTFVPIWEENFLQGLQCCYDDGIQYVEIRTTLPELYDLDGNTYSECEAVCFLRKQADKFQKLHADFIGARLIYAAPRDVGNLTDDIRICRELKKAHPDFFIGFDLFGQESSGRLLKDLLPHLLTMPENIDYFFSAGETNFNGNDTDENLIDAYILGCKRIGHAVAIGNHPILLDRLKGKKIAIEVCPISNQIFNFVADPRTHPATSLFANNQPVVIASASSLVFKTRPLTHDFYVTFMSIAAERTDLRFLKKLIISSLKLSAMTISQRTLALAKWQANWDSYIHRVLNLRAQKPCAKPAEKKNEKPCAH